MMTYCHHHVLQGDGRGDRGAGLGPQAEEGRDQQGARVQQLHLPHSR